MDIHKMNLICTIQQIQRKLNMEPDVFEHIKTYNIPFLETKRDTLIKRYNKSLTN